MQGVNLPANWPVLALSLVLTFVAAYVIAGVVARYVSATLRAIIPDPETEKLFIDRPQRLIKATIFVVAAAALSLPAMKAAGFHTRFGGEPEALARWVFDAGLRI